MLRTLALGEYKQKQAADRVGTGLDPPVSRRTRMRWLEFARDIWSDMDHDNVLGLAAQMSFYFVLSMFPFLISLAALVTVLRFSNVWPKILAWMILYLPHSSRHLVFATIQGAIRRRGSFLSFGLAGTGWVATAGIMNLILALDTIFDLKETRGYIHRTLLSLGVLLLLAAVFLVTFGLHVMGNLVDVQIAAAVYASHPLKWLWTLGRSALSFILAALATAIIYNLLPNHQRKWRWLTTGSLFTVITWALATSGFNFYLLHFGTYQRTYGVLGTFIVLMVWIYVMSTVVLIGAEINYRLHVGREVRGVPVLGPTAKRG
jgi:membrane protein